MTHKQTKSVQLPFEPSTIETIDYALFDWLNDKMNIFCTTNKGWKKTPVIWVAGERAHQIKADKGLRDKSGALIFPLITLQREGINKDPTKKGAFYGNIFPIKSYKGDPKGGSITIARRIQADKSATFLNADSARKFGSINAPNVGIGQINFPSKRKNRKVVYETLTVPMPVYIDVSYAISVRAEYQQQINEMVQPLMVKTGAINSTLIKKEIHSYEMFIQPDFSENNNISSMGDENRNYETKISIRVLGYLVGAANNQEQPVVVKRQSAVDVKIPRERTVFGDKEPWRHGKLPE